MVLYSEAVTARDGRNGAFLHRLTLVPSCIGFCERLLEELQFMIANGILTFSNGSNTNIYRRTPSAWTQEKLIQVYGLLGQSKTEKAILEVMKALFCQKTSCV
ncbi:MAG: hypothetical protein ACFFDI_15870 [Promethearchaeota archaeon]